MTHYLFPLLAAVIWGGNTIIGKLTVGVISPFTMSFSRWLLAALILTPFLLLPLWRIRQVWIPLLPKLALLSLIGIVTFQTTAYYAAISTSAANMGLIGALIPLITVMLSLLLFKERPSSGIIIGAPLSLLGLVVLLTQGDLTLVQALHINPGDGLMLFGASSYALYGVLSKRWQMPLTLWQSMYLQIVIGVLWLIPPLLYTGPSTISAEALPLIMYATLGSSLTATFCWLTGIQRLGASRTSIFMNLVPLVTLLLAPLWLDETIVMEQLGGGLLILLGVILSQQKLSLSQFRDKSARASN